jgi:hypothetical protein
VSGASEEDDVRLEEIAQRWDDPGEEYQALADLIVPAAQQRFAIGLQDWDAIDTKALGVLAAAVAALTALAAFHHAVNHLWWIPAIGLGVSCGLFAAVIWPYNAEQAPDLLDLHDKMREDGALATARELLNDLTKAADSNDEPLALKMRLFGYALIVLALSLAGCLPIVILRPTLT